MHNSIWVDCNGSQLDTHLDTVGTGIVVLNSFRGTGSIYKLHLWNFDRFHQSVISIDQLTLSFLSQPKLPSTSFLGLDRFPIKVWKVFNLADRIQHLWVGQKMFM